MVPKTYTKYTSRKVLTTSWIDGEKLSQSTESDVGELVNVGVICYLKQVGVYLPLFGYMKFNQMVIRLFSLLYHQLMIFKSENFLFKCLGIFCC